MPQGEGECLLVPKLLGKGRMRSQEGVVDEIDGEEVGELEDKTEELTTEKALVAVVVRLLASIHFASELQVGC